jgi:hypothetical protein
MARVKKAAASTKAQCIRKRNAAIRERERRKTALGRLWSDGACSGANVRRRLICLARERKIPLSEIPKIERSPTDEFVRFMKKHNLNYDWVLAGDLKGLQRMVCKDPA